VPVHRQGYQRQPSPADRFFDDFFNLDFPNPSSMNEFVPSLDVFEDDREVRVEVELPGMDEKDIDVNLSGNMLTIRGEKHHEEEINERGVHRRERRYGSFVRTIELPQGLDFEEISANFKNGVLSVRVPKTEEFKQRTRNIPIGERRDLQAETLPERKPMNEREATQERKPMNERERLQREQDRIDQEPRADRGDSPLKDRRSPLE
jgi:HSP20 family protein